MLNVPNETFEIVHAIWITVLQFALLTWLTVWWQFKHQAVSMLWSCYHRFSSNQFLSVKMYWIDITLTGIAFESPSYSSTWLRSASYASVSCGTMPTLTELIAHLSSATERFSKEAVCVVLTSWVEKCTSVAALGFAFTYTARGRAPALSFVYRSAQFSVLTVLCRTGR